MGLVEFVAGSLRLLEVVLVKAGLWPLERTKCMIVGWQEGHNNILEGNPPWRFVEC